MSPAFQRLLFISGQVADDPGSILLASGPSIFVHTLTGQYRSEWRVDEVVASSNADAEQNKKNSAAESLVEESPNKKRKLTSADALSDGSSADIVIDHGNANKRPPKKRANDLPNVANLYGSRDGRHVIVATDVDKCIRVLGLSNEGKLSTLSQRFMPKKVGAMILSIDQETVLCADKFGDVYGLPLHPPAGDQVGLALQAQSDVNSQPSQSPSTFKPAASERTVHTKKNLLALQNQLAQHAKHGQVKKQRINEYQPVLGHVSLLTDILEVNVSTERGRRSYILTSDRDEHIRISRGLPQAHITEGYCLGHSQFVTNLCIPEWIPSLLLSGGGDDFLLSWDWIAGTIRQKIPIRQEIDRVRKSHRVAEGKPLTVSGIWALQTTEKTGRLVVACEGTAALLTFEVDEEGNISASTTIGLESNVLDASVVSSKMGILFTLDNLREPCTTEKERIKPDTVQFGMIRALSNVTGWEEVAGSPVPEIQAWNLGRPSDPATSRSAKGSIDLYYTLEHLRKRGGSDRLDLDE